MSLKENVESQMKRVKSGLFSMKPKQWTMLFLLGVLLLILSMPISNDKYNANEKNQYNFNVRTGMEDSNFNGNSTIGQKDSGTGIGWNYLFGRNDNASNSNAYNNGTHYTNDSTDLAGRSEAEGVDYPHTELEFRLEQVLSAVSGVGRVNTLIMTSETKSDYFSNGSLQVTGILIVADGADNPVTVQNIKDACVSLFQLEPHKIKIMKMK